MPPTRRSRTSSGPAPKGSQKTLSFGNTKSSTPLSKSAKPSPLSKTTIISIKKEEASEEEEVKDLGHITSEAAVQQQAKVELQAVKRTPEEEKASRVTDAQIKRYWRDREAERRSPRVHQGGLTIEEKVLRYWDMCSQYGPAIGIARMKRWVRANKLGLEPPIEVLAVLMREEAKGNSGIERAYVDELMSSKSAIGEA